MGSLRELLGKRLTVSVELNPPKGTDLEKLYAQAAAVLGQVDAFDFTDSHLAKMALSPIVAAYLVKQRFRADVIFNLTCRDRNLIALQSELLGAAALGLENVLVLTGDPPQVGDHPQAKPVYDLDPLGFIRLIKQLNNGFDGAGNPLSGIPSFFVGVTTNPGGDIQVEVKKLRDRVEAGADFAITQAVYDPEVFRRFYEEVKGLEVPLIVGVIPLKSYPFACYLQEKVPGIVIPERSLQRMAQAPPGEARRVGVQIVLEVLEEVLPYASGVHIMPIGDQEGLRILLQWLAARINRINS